MSKSILLVDDMREISESFSELIEDSLNYNVTISDNPIEALELIKNNHFDLVCSDYNMPPMDGVTFLIKSSIPKYKGIIISGTMQDFEINRIKNSGFGFLRKGSFNIDDLLNLISERLKVAS